MSRKKGRRCSSGIYRRWPGATTGFMCARYHGRTIGDGDDVVQDVLLRVEAGNADLNY